MLDGEELAELARVPDALGAGPGGARPRGAAGVVRPAGRGRGDPVGQDRRAAPRTATSARSRRPSTPRSRPRPSSTPTRCSRRPRRPPRSARRSSASCSPIRGPDERTHAAHPRAGAAGARPDRPQRRGQRRHPHRGPGRGASPRAACTATTTTSRPPGRYFGRIVTTHTLGGAGRDLPAGARARHGAVLRGAARHGRDRRAAARAAGRAARGRPGRGAGQLPQPAARHAARRPAARRAARGHPVDRPVPAWPCRA